MLYIHKKIRFWETDSPLPSSYKVGTTEEDYDKGAYLLLDGEQAQFHTDHPKATPSECLNKRLIPAHEPDPLETARQAKLAEIAAQDESGNKFFVSVKQGGIEVINQEFWIDKDLRNSLYSITLPALLADGETTTKLWTTGIPPQSIEVPVSWAMEKLPLLEVYAKRTYDL